MQVDYYILENGVKIPPVGFGTDVTFAFIRKNIIKGLLGILKDLLKDKGYHWKRDLSVGKVIRNSYENGCFLFDTASAYGQSERVLGKNLKGLPREELFVITKLSNEEQSKSDVKQALIRSLKHLRMEYVDLYLMHWPQTDTYIDSWRQMEKLYQEGYVKAIGVCNFHQHHFNELRKHAQIMPMVNEIECHPLFTQKELIAYCQDHKIQVISYTPTGRMDSRLKNDKTLTALSEKYHKTIAQIIIRWHYQLNLIPIINTTKLSHLAENCDIFGFDLTREELEAIDSINIDCRLRYNPDTVDFKKC